MILLLLRCGLLPEQVEAQRREQGDSVGEQLRRAADAHEQVIDGVVDDGDAEQAEQARRAERAAAPHGAQDAAVHAAADDVHRARTEAADEQINELPRAVLRQVADVLEGGEARGHHDGGEAEALRVRLEHREVKEQRQQLHDLLHHRRDLRGGVQRVCGVELGEEGVEVRREQAHSHAREAEKQQRTLFPPQEQQCHEQRGRHAHEDVFDVGHASTAFRSAGRSRRSTSESRKSNQK